MNDAEILELFRHGKECGWFYVTRSCDIRGKVIKLSIRELLGVIARGETVEPAYQPHNVTIFVVWDALGTSVTKVALTLEEARGWIENDGILDHTYTITQHSMLLSRSTEITQDIKP